MYKKQTGVYSRLALLKYWCSLPTWCILLSPLSLTYSPTFTSFSPSPSLLFLLFSVLLLLLSLLPLPSFPSSSYLTSCPSFPFTSSPLPPPLPPPHFSPTLPSPSPPGPRMYPLPSTLRCCLLICNTQRPPLQCMWRHYQTMGHQRTLSKTGKTRFTRQHMHVN